MEEKTTVTVSQLQEEFYAFGGRAITALIPIFIYSIIQLIRNGNQADYLLLLIGCVLSVTAIMGFVLNVLINVTKKKRSFLAMFLAFSGLIPWAFGSYITFIRGFWSLKELAGGFSIIIILKSLIFVLLGSAVVSNLHKITKIERNISSELFIIEEE